MANTIQLNNGFGFYQQNVDYNSISQTYFNHLKTNIRQPIVKIEILRNVDETIIDSIVGDILNEGGNLTITRQNGIRRSVEFTLMNITGKYIPQIDGRVWIRQKVRIYFGLRINEQEYWISQGIYVMDNPTALSDLSRKTVNIKALDKFSLLDGTLGGELDDNLVFPAGSSVFQTIRTVLEMSGDPKSSLIDVDLTQITCYAIEKTCGDKLGDILIELANMLSLEVFYDTNGYLRFQNPVDPLYSGSSYDFGDAEYNYLGASQEYKFADVYNAVLVIGDNSNGQTYSYEAVNNDLLSNINVNALGFKRTKVITDTNIYSTDLAMKRAKYELNLISRLQSSIKINIIPMCHLDVGDVVTLTDPSLKLDRQRFLINGISIPFSIGSKMSIDATIVNNHDLNFS